MITVRWVKQVSIAVPATSLLEVQKDGVTIATHTGTQYELDNWLKANGYGRLRDVLAAFPGAAIVPEADAPVTVPK